MYKNQIEEWKRDPAYLSTQRPMMHISTTMTYIFFSWQNGFLYEKHISIGKISLNVSMKLSEVRSPSLPRSVGNIT